MSAPFSGSLHIVEGKTGRQMACKGCDQPLAPVGKPWKPASTVRERPMEGAGGRAYASASHVVLRRFFCPGCGALLDTETAMAGDPYLNDVIDA